MCNSSTGEHFSLLVQRTLILVTASLYNLPCITSLFPEVCPYSQYAQKFLQFFIKASSASKASSAPCTAAREKDFGIDEQFLKPAQCSDVV